MKVVNSVYTANLNKTYNLSLVSKIIYNSIYKPQRFSGLIFKVGRRSITLFPNGHINILGCQTLKECSKIGRKVSKLLNGELTDVKLTNLVASEDIGKRLDLEKLGNTLRELENKSDRNEYDFSFEPELLAALVWRMKEKIENGYVKVLTAMVFHTGKINYTGAKKLKTLKKHRKF